MAEPSVRVVKTLPFKGGSRLWSNRYHFLGGTPSDATHWHTLMDNIVTAEKAILPAALEIVEVLGYAAGSDVAVASKNYTTLGTHTISGMRTPGECAALVRYSTAARSTKNHPIYGFSYYHGIDVSSSAGNQDVLHSSYVTALNTYAAAWISGFSDGTITVTRCTPAGHACTGSFTEEYCTHRDFPYTPSA